MRILTLLDTVVASTNLGDQIIMDAVRSQIHELFPDSFCFNVASHDWMGRKSRSLLARSDVVIAGGTNMLSSHMWLKPLWKITPLDVLRTLDVTLMGVGWYQYQSKPDPYTRFLLNRVLSKHRIHSARDRYTKEKLESIGLNNVVKTGCPTLWRLSPEHCRNIPKEKAECVVTAINTYIPNPELDKEIIRRLQKHYKKVYFWIQTESDYQYAKSIASDLLFLEPSLEALDRVYESDESIDYVGNRLHAGIRAMQKSRRTIILEIDNRAKEMGEDFNLPTIQRDEFDLMERMITEDRETNIKLPNEMIDSWKNQFRTNKF